MELITVIVPVYNVEQYLLRCVESIQKQTYKNLEIILVDDGSPDNCPQMCDRLASEDSRIKVIHKENAGQGLARNDGLAIANGAYVTFVDSDDWISESHIEHLYAAIERAQADVVLGNHTVVGADGTMSERSIPLKEGQYEGDAIMEAILLPLIGSDVNSHNDILINSSVSMNLYKMDLIKAHDVKFISERYAVAEDFFFNVDFFYYSKKVVFVKEMGYYYFQNAESTCNKYDPKRFERTLNYYQTICERTEKYGWKNRIEHRIERSFLMKIRVAIRNIVTSELKRKDKLCEIRDILGHETVRNVLAQYPIDTYIPSMRFLAKMMRSQRVVTVYYLMKLRETAKHRRLLKSVLKLMGIGK